MRRLAALALLLAATPALAQDFTPQLGRYRPLYPGMYLHAGYAQDDRDASYAQDGSERDSAAPSAGGSSALPQKVLLTQFTWHFPLFESYGLPFVSSRTHMASVLLRYVKTEAEGRLAEFAADGSDDATTEADELRNNGSGIGDVTVEFGSFLAGSGEWRTRKHTPYAVLLALGGTLPFGVYDRDAPANAGDNTWSAHLRLGGHAVPWRGALLDAGAGYRAYFQNYDAAFGGHAPSEPGDALLADLSLAQRILPGLHLTAFGTWRDGDPNAYENPRFAINPPGPPAFSDNFAEPGVYYDQGTERTTVGGAVQYFLGQRWLVALHYETPVSGRSGEFDLRYRNRTPEGCTLGSLGCSTSAGGSARVDGLGLARSYASDRLMVTATYNFGLGDAFSCAGCTR